MLLSVASLQNGENQKELLALTSAVCQANPQDASLLKPTYRCSEGGRKMGSRGSSPGSKQTGKPWWGGDSPEPLKEPHFSKRLLCIILRCRCLPTHVPWMSLRVAPGAFKAAGLKPINRRMADANKEREPIEGSLCHSAPVNVVTTCLPQVQVYRTHPAFSKRGWKPRRTKINTPTVNISRSLATCPVMFRFRLVCGGGFAWGQDGASKDLGFGVESE